MFWTSTNIIKNYALIDTTLYFLVPNTKLDMVYTPCTYDEIILIGFCSYEWKALAYMPNPSPFLHKSTVPGISKTTRRETRDRYHVPRSHISIPIKSRCHFHIENSIIILLVYKAFHTVVERLFLAFPQHQLPIRFVWVTSIRFNFQESNNSIEKIFNDSFHESSRVKLKVLLYVLAM